MWHFIKEHSRKFWEVFVGSGVVWGGVLFNTPIVFNNIFFAFLLKITGAASLAFVTGVFTILGQEFIKKHKHRLTFKFKKNGSKEKSSEENTSQKKSNAA